MKKRFLCLLFALTVLLCGCGIPGGEELTTVVTDEPHIELPIEGNEAPYMMIRGAEEELRVFYSNGSWSEEGSQWIACGMHPLDSSAHIETLNTISRNVELIFSEQPDQITVECWSDEFVGQTDTVSETANMDGNILELKSGSYIYDLTAVWTGKGTLHYYFGAVVDSHIHQPAEEGELVEDPITGYCGNTMTTVHLGDGHAYSFSGSDSVALTNILVNLAYDPDKLCRCISEFTVDTEFGTGYEVNLTKGFVRYEGGQARLTQGQIDTITQIIDRVKTEPI